MDEKQQGGRGVSGARMGWGTCLLCMGLAFLVSGILPYYALKFDLSGLSTAASLGGLLLIGAGRWDSVSPPEDESPYPIGKADPARA